MNIIKCCGGHFFDVDTYTVCPHCGKGPEKRKNQAVKKRKGIFGKEKKFSRETDDNINDINEGSGRTVSYDNDMLQIISVEQEEENGNINKGKGYPRTRGLWNVNTVNSVDEISEKNNNIFSDINDNDCFFVDENIKKENTEDMKNNIIDDKKEESIESAVQKVSAYDKGKTFGYFSLNRDRENKKEISDSEKNNTNNNIESVSNKETNKFFEPAVGWLVCIKGPHWGESFNIFTGKNSIGRNGNNRIVISKDNSVSRDKHAIIIFEPKKREFFIKPGDSNGLVYLNGENIFDVKKIVQYDEIEIGGTTLKLATLCGEQFSWEDYMN